MKPTFSANPYSVLALIVLAFVCFAFVEIGLTRAAHISMDDTLLSSSLLTLLIVLLAFRASKLVIAPDPQAPWRWMLPLLIGLLALDLANALSVAFDGLASPSSPPCRPYVWPWPKVFHIIVIAPLTEELLFPGIALGFFIRRFRPLHSMIAVSIVFALLHHGLNPGPSFVPLLLGMFLSCSLRLRFGSLLPGIALHALHNAAIVAIAPRAQALCNAVVDHDTAIRATFAATAAAMLLISLRLLPRSAKRLEPA